LFVAPKSRRRFRTLLAMVASDPYRRQQLVGEFGGYMDPRFTRRVVPKVFPRLLPILQAKGAPKMCYILSTDDNLIGRELPLDEAVAIVIDDQHMVDLYLVSCVPGRLGFYIASDWYEDRWILERTEGR
jgi:hypothetical protein